MFAALVSLFLTQTLPPASGSQMWWYNDTCTRAGGRCQYMRNGRPGGSKAEFCSVAATYLTGSAWCLQGDGSMRAGSARSPSSGANVAPTTVSRNGYSAVQYYNVSVPNGLGESSNSVFTAPAAYTTCALVESIDYLNTYTLTSMANGVAASNRNWELSINTVPQAVFRAADAAGATSCQSFTGGGGLSAGNVRLVCGVHDGSNVTLYVGSTAATPAACTGILSGVSQRAGVGALWQGAVWQTHYSGYIYGAFYTEQALSGGQITALNGALQ